MRHIIIVAILFIAIITLWIVKTWQKKIEIVNTGSRFCILTKEVKDAVWNPSSIKDMSSQEKKMYFLNMDIDIEMLESLYDEIKDHEADFRAEDWDEVTKMYDVFVEMKQNVKYQKWYNEIS